MKTTRIVALLALAALTAPAYAIVITPTYTTFGTLPVSFGGSGIPNTSVAITTVGGATLGLSAAQRFSNPTVTDNGAGTFFAGVGNDAANGQPGYAQWNFNFHVSGLTTGQSVSLYYDLNPGAGTNVTTFIPLVADFQNSWNLGMGFLGGGFNPNVAGEYDFALVLNGVQGQELGRSAIRVNVVSSVPDAGLTVGLFAVALLGLAAVRRRLQLAA